MSALSQVIDHLDEATIRKMILPKTKQLFDINADTKVGQSAPHRFTAKLTRDHFICLTVLLVRRFKSIF